MKVHQCEYPGCKCVRTDCKTCIRPTPKKKVVKVKVKRSRK